MIPFCFGLLFATIFTFLILLFSLFGIDLFVIGIIFSFIIGVIVGVYLAYGVWDK